MTFALPLRRDGLRRAAARLGAALLAAVGAAQGTACGDSGGPDTAPAVVVQLSDSAVSVRVGDAASVTAVARDVAGQPLEGRRIFWSSRDTTVATVSQAGVVRGVAPGSTQISANLEGQSAVATVAVLARPLTALTVEPASVQLVVGRSQQLTARATNDQGAAAPATVTWTSATPAIVTVSPTGVVTAVSPGVGSVRATTGALTATAVVVVVPVPVAAVRLTPATANLTVGGTQQLTATPVDSAGAELAGRAVVWASQTPAVATVTSSGLVTAVAAGTATITATVDGVAATATVRVTAPTPAPTPPPPTVASVVVSPPSATIVAGSTLQLTATARAADGTPITGRAVAWTSNTPAVATVSASGLVTAVAPGSATITATVDGVAGTSAITVQRPPTPAPAPVAAVAVTPSPATVPAGGTVQLTATPRDASGAALTGRTVTWTSSNAAVATVSSTGLVTGVGPGSATVSATSEGVTGTATVTVSPVVRVTPAADTIRVGGPPPGRSTQLVATDHAGRTLTASQVTWSTSNAAVATVSSTGLVSAVSAPSGGTTVTITATYLGATATAQIRVNP